MRISICCEFPLSTLLWYLAFCVQKDEWFLLNGFGRWLERCQVVGKDVRILGKDFGLCLHEIDN